MNRHTYIFLFFIISILFPLAFSISINTLSSTEILTISSNRTITSPGNVFELGFFKPSSNSRWYLGIWYKKVPERTYVWVANRDKPLHNHKGTLKISNSNLVLLDYSNNPVWSTNLTRGDKRSPMVAELLDNGNFVLKDSKNNRFLWQSFDFPTDTLLPEMKLGKNLKTGVNRFLRSWRSRNDPSSGDHTFKLETRGFPEFFLYVKNTPVHRSGSWDGIRFSGLPEMQKSNYMVSNFTETRDEVVYTFKMTNQSIYSRITISPSGIFQQSIWNPKSWGWNLVWIAPKDQCDLYNSCGSYGYCDMKMSPVCNCIQGFKPRSPKEWALKDGSRGCVRRTRPRWTRPRCGRDGFIRLRKMKLPDSTRAIVDKRIGIKECEKRCVRDCKCTAYATMDIRNGGSGCVIWTRELVDLRNFGEGGQDLYVRSSHHGY